MNLFVKKFIYLTLLFFASSLVYAQDKPSGAHDTVRVLPQFNGDLYRYLANAVIYPKKEQYDDITGIVYASFVVEKNGTITDVKLLKGVAKGPGLDSEALRVLRAMPKWNPGTVDGVPVRVQYNIPISFDLGDWNERDTTAYLITKVKKQPFYKQGDPVAFIISALKTDFNTEVKSGKVTASFIIEKNGFLSQITIISGISADLDSKVIQCIKNMEQWEPGIRKRKSVRVKYFLTIDFGSLPNK